MVRNEERGPDGLVVAQQVAQAASDGTLPVTPESELALLAAVPDPPTLFLLAANYQSHMTGRGWRAGR